MIDHSRTPLFGFMLFLPFQAQNQYALVFMVPMPPLGHERTGIACTPLNRLGLRAF
ncbi:hypothetical protein X474_00300 [Dethiosulfatarculus sandiegensis]|uniref:Uncharacterized protein n=1 Tax=Dethiosulfatarculus sandiegensis TaxID=1429043 RepID=A0A0D2GN38_9BACT|nr:hypothetical protein X474_00300 [Dethiosulfatarculus sandiegensis]